MFGCLHLIECLFKSTEMPESFERSVSASEGVSDLLMLNVKQEQTVFNLRKVEKFYHVIKL